MKKVILFTYILFSFITSHAQFQTVFAGIGTDIQKATGQSYHSYKGLSGGRFIIQATVKKRGEGNNYSVGLQTQNIYMDKYYSYTYKPGFKRMFCNNGTMLEEPLVKESFDSNDIGSKPFEKIMASAEATFDIKITFIIKDEKYTNGGYRVERTFKNAKANSLYWDENPVKGDFDIAEVKILNNPKLVSFIADESDILPAIEKYLKTYNANRNAECEKQNASKAARNARIEESQKQKSGDKEKKANNANDKENSSSYSNIVVNSSNIAYQNKQEELERIRQVQINKNEELKRKQQLAKEENERIKRQQLQELQAQLAENRRKAEALNAASDEAFKQWGQGNYVEGTKVLANEYAEQGKTDAALATVAVGAGLELVTSIIETNRRHEEEKERKAEQARIAEEKKRRLEEIEEEKRKILEQQKREFYSLVEAIRKPKKNILNQRDRFLYTKIELTPTYDLFSDDNLPIYIFYVQTDNDYNKYNERISFPDMIDININENAILYFSPIIAIYPNTSGEYPFIKEILSDIETKLVDSKNGKYKIYNWSKNFDEIQTIYNQESQSAIQNYFNVVLPDETLINLSKMNIVLTDDEIDYLEE